MAKRILIAGGGHSSLPIIKMGKLWQKKGYSISLITSDPYLIYSGGLPQYMGGFYSFDEISINLKILCKRYGTEFIHDTVTDVSSKQNRIETESGRDYIFDVLLINVGAKTDVKNRVENVYPVKPMSELLPLLTKLREGKVKRLLIAGGGAAGTEIALNITHPGSVIQTELTLVEYQSSILSSFPDKASRIASDILQKRGVAIKTSTSYSHEDAKQFDAVIDATGNQPASLSLKHDLVTGHHHRILTQPSLLANGTDNIFAAGDTADVDGNNYTAVGVHAVKQGPLLRNNIIRLLEGRRLDTYKPYPVNPLILSNGNSDAIFTAGGLCSRGPWASLLKFVLDMHWVEKYTQSKQYRRSVIELINAAYSRSLKM
jgi:NADH dehydrogenase FAD-containing subunit